MKSMTGFGAGEAGSSNWLISVEISTVNRKQLDVAVHLPPLLQPFDGDARQLITKRMSRGRVMVKASLTSSIDNETQLTVDHGLAAQYIEAAQKIASDNGLGTQVSAADLFRAPGIFQLSELESEPEELKDDFFKALNDALVKLDEMQSVEGENLRSDLLSRLETIETEMGKVGPMSKSVVEYHRKNLHQRLADSGLDIDLDDERLLREIGLFADRCDVSEEITRIASHIGQFRTYFDSKEPVGRPLDFLCQELNRELNTVGSKANDAEIAMCVVNSKTELEKVREQVQNVQ
ncbi:MAG: YicC/YloC family endoribonuclease [Verrucomicrobiota bacterium]